MQNNPTGVVPDSVNNTITNKHFKFTGKGLEYFSIWIVNVVLTILTLGIYSAWAKVRTNQYFYGNTFLDGSSFRYTAKPLQILKGRIIATILFAIYYFTTIANPIVAGIILIIIMLFVPAFVVMAMSFRLRNSQYRNVHFNFDKNFSQAYKVFFIPLIFVGCYLFLIGQAEHLQPGDREQSGNAIFGLLILGVMLGIFVMVPWWEFIVTRFKATHAKYGQADFSFSATLKNYYGMYLKALLLSIIIFGLLGAGIFTLQKTQPDEQSQLLFASMMSIFVFPAYLWLFAYFQTKRTNLLFGNLSINGHHVRSEMTTGRLLMLYITNTLAIMLTFGLLMPWAKVRTANYKASITSLDVAGELNQFVTSQEQQQSAMGEEIGEMFDLDLGF